MAIQFHMLHLLLKLLSRKAAVVAVAVVHLAPGEVLVLSRQPPVSVLEKNRKRELPVAVTHKVLSKHLVLQRVTTQAKLQLCSRPSLIFKRNYLFLLVFLFFGMFL